jgi:hypothetical protein
LFLWLLSHIEQLDVNRSVKASDLDLFMNCIISPCAIRVSKRELSFLVQCLHTYLINTTKEGRLRIFINRAGLALLSICFSCAYATYRTSSTISLYEEQRSAWKYQFSQFFSEHTGTFIYLFSNPSHSLVWEFLSSLASLADQKQQVVLLTEVRDKVLESAMAFKCQADTNATFSVNTFLNCLGLNVDQLIAA